MLRVGRMRLRAACIACASLAAPTIAMAGGDAALQALAAGDCERANREIDEGLARNEARAFFVAGTLFDATDCGIRDANRAVHLYQRAIALGDDEARNSLGLMYALGRGVPQDYLEADRWFTQPLPGQPAPKTPDDDAARADAYARTLTQLARARVRYPTHDLATGSIRASFNLSTQAVRFVKASSPTDAHIGYDGTFTHAIGNAYAAAFREAPRLERAPPVWYEAPWSFRGR